MEVRGMRYIWAPQNQFIYVSVSFLPSYLSLISSKLYAGTAGSTFLASVLRTQTSIAIQMTSDALQLQLNESIFIAALLLQCGRNIY